MPLASFDHWLASLEPAQKWMAGVLVVLLLGRLVQAATSQQSGWEALFNLGIPAVLAAAAGGLRLLIGQSEVLQGATTTSGGEILSHGEPLGAVALKDLGDHLFVNSIYVYIVFVLVVAMIFLEAKCAISARKTLQFRIGPLIRSVGVGYLVPAFIGGFALYLMYTAS